MLFAPSRSYRVASYIRAAAKQGYRLLIVSDSKHSLIPAISSGITIDFHKPKQALAVIKAAIQGKQIIAVIATDDLVVTLASEVAAYLGLPHNDPISATLTRRKDLARQRMQQFGCLTPRFQVCAFSDNLEIACEIDYPVVIKPLMLSGSRGVIRANSSTEFIEATRMVQKIVASEPCTEFERSHFLIESFLRGAEIALDGFVHDRKLHVLALFEKPAAMDGPYFEESYYITPGRHDDDTRQAIIEAVESACEAYGLSHGPIHAEARLTPGGVVLIEMASRTIGGQCAQAVEYVLGASLEEIVLRMSCGDMVIPASGSNHAGVLMIPIPGAGILRRVEGLLQAQKVRHVTQIDIHIQPGYELVPLPHGSSYLGFIFASANTFAATYQALRTAHERLRFITAPNWRIEPLQNA